MNVEIVTFVAAIKYIFKYVLKGPDQAEMTMGPLQVSATSAQGASSDAASDAQGPSAAAGPSTKVSSAVTKSTAAATSASVADAQSPRISDTRVNANVTASSPSRDGHANRVEDADAAVLNKSHAIVAVDEVNMFRKARWWCVPQAAWKLLAFTIYHQKPNVVRSSSSSSSSSPSS